MAKKLTLDEIISQLSGESFDAAINNPDDYMVVLNKSEADAKQAILQWVADTVVGDVSNAKGNMNYMLDLRVKEQRQILKAHGWVQK